MKKYLQIKNLALVLSLGLLSFMALPRSAFALFTLSVRPYEGGYELRYGKIGPDSPRVNREVTFTINTDINKQYRITQTILEPLSNMQGDRIPDKNFIVYAIRASNRFGTINVEQETPLRFGRQVIYTSNQTGNSDSFILVYSLLPTPDLRPGLYRGRISFMLESIFSSQVPVNIILDVLAEVSMESKIEIKTASGAKAIVLKPDAEIGDSDVLFSIKGGFGRQFKIMQMVTQQPISSDGDFLGWEGVTFKGSGAQRGMVINEPTNISATPQIIYNSSPRGEEDNFIISYSLGDLSRQKAGNYVTTIKYLFEGIGSTTPGMKTLDTFGLEIRNPRLFEMIITPELGGTIEFNELKPSQPPRLQEVTFEIKSNIGKPYQITQKMGSLLTTKEGKAITQEYFTLKEASLETKGTLKCPTKTEVKVGEMVLFVSDKKGSSDKFKATYELRAPQDVAAGDYATTFVYSISEI